MLSDKLDELRNSLRNLNHDVRSPINGIVGIADLLINDDKTNRELPKQDLTMIKDSAQAIIEKIDGVLHTIDTGDGSKKDLEVTPLSNVCEKIKRLYNPLGQQKSHSLVVSNRINKEIRITHNFSVVLTQIIGNLVGNAIKFTPTGGTIIVAMSQKAKEDKHILIIIIEDNGKGMTSEQLIALNSGKPIKQSKGTANEKSFGIGLAHIRQLVDKQNGSIVAKKNEEQGTTFILTLPIPNSNEF